MRFLDRCLLGAALLFVAGSSRVAGATPLNLVLPDYPDILSQFVDVQYTAGSGSLSVHGVSLQIGVSPGVTYTILDGSFDIQVVTDGTTVSGVGGDDLSISGGLDTDNDGVAEFTGLLLSGEINLFGSSASGPGVFEFVFDLTDGELFGPGELFALPQAGVILGADGNSTYGGSFAADFSNLAGGQAGTGTGSSDTAPIPEPGTVLLLGAGCAGLVGFGRRPRG